MRALSEAAARTAPRRRRVTDLGVVTVEANDPRRLTRLPDTAGTLVFRMGRGLMVAGPQTRAGYHAGKDVPLWIRYRLRPGLARPLLGAPMSELADRAVPLDELWGGPGARLDRDLAAIGDDPGRIVRRMEEALRERLSSLPARDLTRNGLLRAAAGALSAGARPEGVRAVAERLGVSERHLRDLFATDIGVSPKHFARIDRVLSVLSRAGGEGWARIAADAGYCDQSHMTADFRDLMGVPPGAFAAGRLPEPLPC